MQWFSQYWELFILLHGLTYRSVHCRRVLQRTDRVNCKDAGSEVWRLKYFLYAYIRLVNGGKHTRGFF